MLGDLSTWKQTQLKNINLCSNIEHIFESKEAFIIVFDKNMQVLNHTITKSSLNNRQKAINEFLNLSQKHFVHKRINDKIYKELLSKISDYLKIQL